ncbi:rho guanine nucleotide exchange factor 37 [Alosa sapidissima]|uniref:rho guanine nucleotide exchange factor 37 n=1 Tax=Alosa sapidissima TaxID=34773 RepID=UPI001C09F22D|nr:rho guanine nucleotide exchange factor 37 [Alosa sapidissima]XP_041918013.1 rho guanine nucleotide exchange factor 37 [Alosa sapidissima]XP_041918014.1 rho guanine nucleotide exchange factor 37 [Alosa sapidissima]
MRGAGGAEESPPSEEATGEEEEPTKEEEKEMSAEEKERLASEQAAARERAAQRQVMAMEELIHTERTYLKHLQLCTVTIRDNLQKIQPPLRNLDGMFQHIDEVMDVSARLLSLLDQTQMQPSDAGFLQFLCDSFLSLSRDIEMAYKEYLANYNNITALENSYKQQETQWAEMVNVVKTSAPEINASNLTFFLVMPVQRIARYPLLLQTIQKHTEPTHPAYETLTQAAHIAVQLNCRINEYKRFREVADKYKRTETLTIRDKINRLSGHSIAKKTARLSQFLKHETGMVPQAKDEEFDTLVAYFFVIEKGVSELHENLETYLSHLQRLQSCRAEDHDLDMEADKGALFSREIAVALRQWIYPEFERRLQSLVFKPLGSLRELLAGPRNLIRKRRDKLLDYEVLEEKSALSYEEQAVVNTYRTIHALLLNELPQFNGRAMQLLLATLGNLSCLLRDLSTDMEQLANSFTQQLPHSWMDSREFWKWAESSVLEAGRSLESLCQSVQDELNAPIVQPLSSPAQKRLKALLVRHSRDKIYQLTGPVVGARDLDLTLSKGELVAVVSEMDTRGDRRRWLVDAGGPRGYVPASKLARYHLGAQEPPPPSPSPSPYLSVTLPAPGTRRHSYTATPPSPGFSIAMPSYQVYAGYDFTARGSHEVSLRAGEPVRVLEPHDKRGNAEWSLVEARGHKGYVPSNYLAVLPAMVASPTFPYR